MPATHPSRGQVGAGRRVLILDTTLRDGEQTPGVAFTAAQKLEIAGLLDEAGVPIISVGYPAVSQQEREAIRGIVAARDRGELRCRLSVLARPVRGDMDLALDCGIDYVSLFLPTSDILMRAKFGEDGRRRVRALLEEGIEYAARRRMAFNFAAEDATRSDYAFMLDVLRLASAGRAETLMLCDTVGVALPESMAALVRDVSRDVPGASILLHCHNDYGMATANTVAAIAAGAAGASVTFNGIGERAGNAPLEEVVLALHNLYGLATGVETEAFARLAELVERHSRIRMDPFKPVTGAHAFRHESGIHVAALLKEPLAYHPFPPSQVGRRPEFVLGKHSGRAVIGNILASRGVRATQEELESLAAMVKEETSGAREAFSAEDLLRAHARLRGGQAA